MFNKLSILAGLSFAALALADNVVIGYRTVSKMEGKEINKEGWLIYDSRWDFDHQLGKGKSLGGRPGDWDIMPGNMYCVVSADECAFQNAKKAWIPPSRHFSKEEQIRAYINSGKISEDSKTWNAAETMRFAEIVGRPGQLELFLPNALIGDKSQGGPLYIYAECYDTIAELRAQWPDPAEIVDIDYSTWDIEGPRDD